MTDGARWDAVCDSVLWYKGDAYTVVCQCFPYAGSPQVDGTAVRAQAIAACPQLLEDILDLIRSVCREEGRVLALERRILNVLEGLNV